MNPVLLLTGFEPFDGHAVNPSWEVAQALHGQVVAGLTVQSLRLPCTFSGSASRLLQAINRQQPRVVLSLGLAPSRTQLSIERLAVNINDARIPDNQGVQPRDEPVVPGGPAAHFSTLPVKAQCAAVAALGVPVVLSYTAGTYVCNHVFYSALHHAQARPGLKVGFINLPPLQGEFSLERQKEAVLAALSVWAEAPGHGAEGPGGTIDGVA